MTSNSEDWTAWDNTNGLLLPSEVLQRLSVWQRRSLVDRALRSLPTKSKGLYYVFPFERYPAVVKWLHEILTGESYLDN